MGLLNGNSSLQSIVSSLIGLIDMLVAVLASLAIVVFFWGMVNYVINAESSEAHTRARDTILWSLLTLFVLFSIWGILALLKNSQLLGVGGF